MNAYRLCTVYENDLQLGVHEATRPMIRLSKLTDYAVVVLARMASCPGVLVSASCLAGATGLPEPTVSKVLKQLARAGLLTSVRGATGGYRLDGDPADLKLTDIITAMEGSLTLTACVEGSTEICALESVCSLQGRWTKVNRALAAALAPLTLADMMPTPMEKRA